MSHTNGSFAVNGNDHHPSTNGHGQYMRPKPNKSLKFTDFVPIPTIIIGIVAAGLGAWNMIHPQPPPSPEELAAQRAKAARIEELQSEIDVRQDEIDARQNEIDVLNPPDQYDSINEPLHP